MTDCFEHLFPTCHWPLNGMHSLCDTGPVEELLDGILESVLCKSLYEHNSPSWPANMHWWNSSLTSSERRTIYSPHYLGQGNLWRTNHLAAKSRHLWHPTQKLTLSVVLKAGAHFGLSFTQIFQQGFVRKGSTTPGEPPAMSSHSR